MCLREPKHTEEEGGDPRASCTPPTECQGGREETLGSVRSRMGVRATAVARRQGVCGRSRGRALILLPGPMGKREPTHELHSRQRISDRRSSTLS